MKLKTTPETYYHQALHILQSIPPLNRLHSKELLVLGEIMYYEYLIENRLLRDVPLSNHIRDLIATKLGMTPSAFRTTLSSLRKHLVLIDRLVHPNLRLIYLQPLNFEFHE